MPAYLTRSLDDAEVAGSRRGPRGVASGWERRRRSRVVCPAVVTPPRRVVVVPPPGCRGGPGVVPPPGCRGGPGVVPPPGCRGGPGAVAPPGCSSGPGVVPPPGCSSGPGAVAPPGCSSGPGVVPPPGCSSGPGAVAPPGCSSGPGAVAPPGCRGGPGAVAPPGCSSGPGAVGPPGCSSGPGIVAPPGGVHPRCRRQVSGHRRRRLPVPRGRVAWKPSRYPVSSVKSNARGLAPNTHCSQLHGYSSGHVFLSCFAAFVCPRDTPFKHMWHMHVDGNELNATQICVRPCRSNFLARFSTSSVLRLSRGVLWV